MLYRVGTAVPRFVLLGFLALTAACTRQQSPEPEARGALPVPVSAPERLAAPPAPEAVQLDAAPPATIGSSGLLAHRLRRRLLPEDAMIGPLADPLRAAASERAALDAAGRLLAAVRHGDLTHAPLSTTGLIHVAASIDHHLQRGMALAGFRLGMVERTGDTAFLRARLSGPLGSIPGELYLIRADDRWLVDDLQADWAALQHAQPEPEPIPLPRPHGWVYF